MTNKHKHAGGRPTLYTEKLADNICEMLASGTSMRTISLDENMPCCSTMFKWIRENEEFSQQYAIAKQECADALVEEILDIADDGTNDWMEAHGKDGDNVGWKINGESMQRSRLRVDTRKWIASKMKPKKYGDKLFQETKHSGTVGMRDVTQMSVDDLEDELKGG